jgi:hypothetical protein
MKVNPELESLLLKTRRQFLGSSGIGLGGIAMASLLGPRYAGAAISYDPTTPPIASCATCDARPPTHLCKPSSR